jgi:hypothetical protein
MDASWFSETTMAQLNFLLSHANIRAYIREIAVYFNLGSLEQVPSDWGKGLKELVTRLPNLSHAM